MRTTFYEAVLPPTGSYCAVGIQGGKVITTFHDSLDSLADRGDVLANEGIDAYFALASYRDPEEGRKAANAQALRSFFLDIDVGDNKPYVDQAAAAQALRAFLTATKLPDPIVVNSGRGLHVYWPLDTALPVDEWRAAAVGLKALCKQHELHIDPAVTADAARILRMPGTLNHKSDPPLPVAIVVLNDAVALTQVTSALPEVAPAPSMDLSAAKLHGMDAMTSTLAQGDYPKTQFTRLVQRSLKGVGCGQIAHAVREADTLEEPLWRAALSIAWRCTDAETAIHKLSSPHPGYDPNRTLAKAQATKGPTTCKWYRDNFSEHCKGCTHKVTSPILLGRKVEQAEAVGDHYVVEHPAQLSDGSAPTVQVHIPVYPYPYFRGVNGGVYQRSKDKDGNTEEIEIYRYDLYVTNRQYDSDEQGDGEGELVSVHLHTPHDGIRRFVAPVAQLLVKEKMRDLLLKHGVVALSEELNKIMGYLAASIRNLQRMGAADRTRNQMGWTADLSGFVVGELEYLPSKVRLAPASSATRNIAPHLMVKGSLEEWTKVVDFYNRPGMETHALAVFFGFGAPLLRLYGGLEVRGAMINLMSNKSGTGKTTVQTVINSLFGHPTELLLKENDTVLSRVQWLGKMNHIAVTMDEMTNMTDEQASNLIYDIPQGRGRHRMESQSNKMRVNTTSWQTFVVTSSNSSLYDKLMRLKMVADGELRRLIELKIQRPSDVTKAESDAVFRRLGQNYGLAGPKFVQHVMTHREEVDTIFEQIRERLAMDVKLDQSDRFHAMAFAVALTGGIVARKIGLHHIDVQRVYKEAVKHLTSIKREVIAPVSDSARTAIELLAVFLNENIPNTLVINSNRVHGVPNAALQTPRGPLRVRFEPDMNEIWIPANLLRDYFVDRQVDFKSAIAEMTAKEILKNGGQPSGKKLSAGALIGFEASQLRCYCFDAAQLGMDTDAFQASLLLAG